VLGLSVVPLLISVVLGCFGGALVKRVKPGVAVRVFSIAAFTVSLSTGLTLAVLAVVVCVQLEPFPSWGRWEARTLRATSAVPWSVGLVALALLVLCAVAALVQAVRSGRTLLDARRAVHQLAPAIDGLVVVESDEPIACTVATPRGPIVVSTAMLASLSGDERRVLVAHERSHLRHRHYLYLHAVRLAAAANPFIRPIAEAVADAVERWADEDAATEVGDRLLAARALTRAGLARVRHRPSGGAALAVADSQVVQRVRSLMSPPLRTRPLVLVSVAAVAAAAAAAAAVATLRLHDLVEIAEWVYGPT
jgi:Zn-dependent protease with chaperone function